MGDAARQGGRSLLALHIDLQRIDRVEDERNMEKWQDLMKVA